MSKTIEYLAITAYLVFAVTAIVVGVCISKAHTSEHETLTIRHIPTGRIIAVRDSDGNLVDVDGEYSVGRAEDWEAKPR